MHTIVLVEPRKSYRAILESCMSTSFDVVAVSSFGGAMRAVSMHSARGLVASLFQTGDTNGLELAKQARAGRMKLLTIVYGAPNGGVSRSQIQQAERDYQLAVYMARTMAPAVLADRLIGELRREMNSTSTAINQRAFSAGQRDLSALPSFSARAERPAQDTWAEIMKKDVSARSLRELAAKSVVFEPIDRSWSDADPSWNELMKTKATPSAMKALVRKGLGIKVKKTA
jgi:hypothetical protein